MNNTESVNDKVRLTPSARRDFSLVQAYYDEVAPEQTARFIKEFFTVTRRLEDFPYAGPIRRRTARRLSLRVFPYHLWYRVDDQTRKVEVLAVLHHRQSFALLDDRLHMGE